MVGLASVLQTAQESQSLRSIFERQLRREEPVPPLGPGTNIRASGFASLCPREEVICSLENVIRTNVVDAGLALVFAQGTAIHWVLQNVVFPPGVLYGRWRCTRCGKKFGYAKEGQSVVEAFVPRPAVTDCCESGDPEKFLYREAHFSDTALQIAGHPDGFLRLPGHSTLGLFEAKTISDRGFWEVKNVPLFQHVIQMQVYFMLTGLKWGRILYWNKGGFGMDALKEHQVDRDEDTIEKIRLELRSIWDGIAQRKLPGRTCATKDCPRAKTCVVVRVCFATKEG